MIRFDIGQCALGPFLAAWSDTGLCALELADTSEQLLALLRTDFPSQVLRAVDPPAPLALQHLARILDQPHATPPDLPLSPQGTAFQRRVWQALADIPPGHTKSYSQLARQLEQPTAARAVANACAANKLAILIPCHRVIRGDGSLGGYRWGLARKQALLLRESNVSR